MLQLSFKNIHFSISCLIIEAKLSEKNITIICRRYFFLIKESIFNSQDYNLIKIKFQAEQIENFAGLYSNFVRVL
jgi:hypothetical protein